jgi:hypothetical protein
MSISEMDERRLFGVPTVLTLKEVRILLDDLLLLWSATYGRRLGEVDGDLSECKIFFDPLARGHKIRERLSDLESVSPDVASRMKPYGEPLVTDVGDSVLLVGVEARLLVEILQGLRTDRGHSVIPDEEVYHAQERALQIYRDWSLSRLRQVADLRSGEGKEVMQGIAVGLVLALLVNRSDSPERAVIQWESNTIDAKDVDEAVYVGAEAFASVLTSRNKRTAGEKRLKGGYALTEARRRLAHRLVVVRDDSADGSRVFIPAEYRDEVVKFLAHDLGRRANLSEERLQAAYDQLIVDFRSSARALAYRSMIFERASDTEEIGRTLMREFHDYRTRASVDELQDSLFAAE